MLLYRCELSPGSHFWTVASLELLTADCKVLPACLHSFHSQHFGWSRQRALMFFKSMSIWLKLVPCGSFKPQQCCLSPALHAEISAGQNLSVEIYQQGAQEHWNCAAKGQKDSGRRNAMDSGRGESDRHLCHRFSTLDHTNTICQQSLLSLLLSTGCIAHWLFKQNSIWKQHGYDNVCHFFTTLYFPLSFSPWFSFIFLYVPFLAPFRGFFNVFRLSGKTALSPTIITLIALADERRVVWIQSWKACSRLLRWVLLLPHLLPCASQVWAFRRHSSANNLGSLKRRVKETRSLDSFRSPSTSELMRLVNPTSKKNCKKITT